MPEGDTLHKLARRLAPALEGSTVRSAWGREQGDIRPASGARIESVRALGKNLIVELSGGWSFRVHLGIGGRGDLYEQGQRWRRPRSKMTLVIATETHEAVFFHAPKARLERSAHLRADPGLRLLGQDLLAESFDVDKSLARLRKPRRADWPIAIALLDQRIAAGIGNVYKSELLFLERVAPTARVGDLDDDCLRALYLCARELLQANLGDGARVTVTPELARRGERHWVYQRTHRPCFRCGTPIVSQRQGDQARTTYCCPGCQRLSAHGATNIRGKGFTSGGRS